MIRKPGGAVRLATGNLRRHVVRLKVDIVARFTVHVPGATGQLHVFNDVGSFFLISLGVSLFRRIKPKRQHETESERIDHAVFGVNRKVVHGHGDVGHVVQEVDSSKIADVLRNCQTLCR